MDILNLTETQNCIRLSFKEREDLFVEVPSELIRRMMLSNVDDYPNIVSEIYGVELDFQVPFDYQSVVAPFVYVRLDPFNLCFTSFERGINLKFGIDDEGMRFLYVCVENLEPKGEQLLFSEEIHLNSFSTNFHNPNLICCFDNQPGERNFVRNPADGFECQVTFQNVDLNGRCLGPPLLVSTYEGALQIFDRSVIKTLWETFRKVISRPILS